MPTLWWKELTSNFSVLGFAVRESGYPDKAFYLCGKELKKIVYDRDRDWTIKTVGISGLRKNLGRDGGIEESYRGPSMYIHVVKMSVT